MSTWTRRVAIGALLAGSLTLSVYGADSPAAVPISPTVRPKAEAVPYGHKDFYPSADRPIGFRGDGNGSFPGATPVTAWCALSGQEKNLVWKAQLPSYGNCAPIVIGDRVVVAVEPHTLLCYSARDGKLLWHSRRDILDLPATDTVVEERLPGGITSGYAPGNIANPYYDRRVPMSPEDAARLRRLFGDLMLFASYRSGPKNDTVLEGNPGVVKRLEAAAPELLEAATGFLQPCPEGRAFPKIPVYVTPMNFLQNPFFGKYGLRSEFNVGITYPTPVSDGKCVYWVTSHSIVGCFDLEGRCVWMKYFPDWEELYHAPSETWVASPLLVEGKLITSIGRRIRAIDAATGRQLWKVRYGRKKYGHGSLGFLGVLHLKGPDGKEAAFIVADTGDLWRVSDGKLMFDGTSTSAIPNGVAAYGTGRGRPGPGGIGESSSTMPIVADEVDTVLFMANGSGGGPPSWHGLHAVRYAWTQPEKVTAEHRWFCPGERFTYKPEPPNRKTVPEGVRFTWSDSTVPYVPSLQRVLLPGPKTALLNPLDGSVTATADTVLPGVKWMNPVTSGALALAFDGEGGGTGWVVSLDPLSLVTAAGVRELKLQPRLTTSGYDYRDYERAVSDGVIGWLPPNPRDGSMQVCYGANPFLQGDRVFIRTRRWLFCLGDPKKPWHTPKGAPPEARVK